MKDTPKVLLIADGGPSVGGGHVMRSLALAEALTSKSAQVELIAPQSASAILDRFAPPDLATTLIADEGRPEDVVAWARGPGQPTIQQADLLVFDHFGLDRQHHAEIRQSTPSAAIDDLADRPLDVDLVADPGPDRLAQHYARLTDAELLLGPSFAIVRPEFIQARCAALTRRHAQKGQVKRLQIAMGLTDVGGITRQVVETVLPVLGDIEIDVIVGENTLSHKWLHAQSDPRLKLHVSVHNMAELTAAADLVIGAGGTSSYERCVVGVPSLVLILVENQRSNAEALAKRGAAHVIESTGPDFGKPLRVALQTILNDPKGVHQMALDAARLCDGEGAVRVSQHLLKLYRASKSAA